MAAAPKVSRAALEAAAKAAGLNIRRITPSQKRALCAAASAGANGGSATAATGTGAPGAGLGAADIVTNAPGTGTGAAGAGLAAAAGLGVKGSAGLGAGDWIGAPAVALSGEKATGTGGGLAVATGLGVNGSAGLGFRVGVPSVARAGGGHGSGRASNAMLGVRAAFSTDETPQWPACRDCENLRVHFNNKERLILEEIAELRKEVSTMRADNMKYSFGIVASGLGAFVAVAGFIAPFIQKAWQADTIAEVDRQAAARKQEAQGGVKGEGPGAAPPTSAVPSGAADQGQKKGLGNGGK